MDFEPLITIVIPVRDRATIVGRTLKSVCDQTLRPLRVVLVDNGSCDATPEVLRLWGGLMWDDGIDVCVVNEPRPGAAVARNRGLQEVSTRYVMFFDSDDTMHRDHCRMVVEGIKEAGYPDIAGWPVRQNVGRGHSKVGRFSRRCRLTNHLFHGSMSTVRFAVRTDLIRSVGGWDERLRGWDDYELGIRLLMAAGKVVRLPLSPDTVQIYPQEESITGTAYSPDPAKWEEALDICAGSLVAGGRHDMVRWIDVRRVILAGEYRREGRDDLADRLMGKVLDGAPGAWHRAVYGMLHRYFITAGRGVPQLARLLLPR